MLGAFEDRSPIDPDRLWFAARLAGQAEAMWRRHFGKPPPAARRPAPTPAEIAYVEAACREARANIAAWGERNAAAFAAPRRGDPVKRVRDELGVSVSEQAVEREAADG
ncbi:MAG: hypothetical protein IVW56_09730 [Candidatus Binataceae bacterium]|nr:hypothetical protein [Candidatus Binataceae bacterium]MBF6560559.1 hypothetical protein [Candidatus Binataceae bacterium]